MGSQGRLIVKERQRHETMIFDSGGVFFIEGRLIDAFKKRFTLGRRLVRAVDQVADLLASKGRVDHEGTRDKAINGLPTPWRQEYCQDGKEFGEEAHRPRHPRTGVSILVDTTLLSRLGPH